MKTKILIAALALAPVIAQADLVDLTPGGITFPFNGGAPPAYIHAQQFTELDRAIDTEFFANWLGLTVGLGGTYLSTNLFDISPSTTAQVGWNLNGQPDGYFMAALVVFGPSASDLSDTIINVYGLTFGERFESGPLTVTLPGSTQIEGISFRGENNLAPDTGSTLVLLGLGLVVIGSFRYLAEPEHA